MLEWVIEQSFNAIESGIDLGGVAGWSHHFGLLLLGWGLFNIVEGLIDHHILQVHHGRDDLGGPLSWDIGFLVFGVLLVLVGWALYRRGAREWNRQRSR